MADEKWGKPFHGQRRNPVSTPAIICFAAGDCGTRVPFAPLLTMAALISDTDLSPTTATHFDYSRRMTLLLNCSAAKIRCGAVIDHAKRQIA